MVGYSIINIRSFLGKSVGIMFALLAPTPITFLKSFSISLMGTCDFCRISFSFTLPVPFDLPGSLLTEKLLQCLVKHLERQSYDLTNLFY